MELGLKITPTKKGDQKKRSENEQRWRSRLRSSRFVKFLPFLLLAFVIWVQQTLQREIIRPLNIPIAYDSVEVAYGVQSKVPEVLELQIKDKGWEHILYSLRGLDTLQLRYLLDKQGLRYVGIESQDLSDAVAARLSREADVVQMSFSELRIPLYKRISKKLAVRLPAIPMSANGYTISRLSLSPDSVLVYGAEQQLIGLSGVETIAWGDSIVSTSTKRKLSLNLPEGLYSKTDAIDVELKLEELTQQSYTLPIIVLNAPTGYKITTFPSTASVILTIPRSYFNRITEDNLRLTADYNSRNEDGEMPVHLSKRPSSVVQVRISTEVVQFIKEATE